MFYTSIKVINISVNYGDPSVSWDKLFGAFFDGSKESKIKMKDRF